MCAKILDLYLFSPLYTARGLLWNIRTLGFIWWARCVAQNSALFLLELVGRRQLEAEVVRARRPVVRLARDRRLAL